MKLHNAAAVLFVRDAKRARDFYVGVLGMTVKADFGGLNYIMEEGFALWQPLDENIIPRTAGDAIFAPTGAPRFELCFETEDIDGDYRALKEHGVRFFHEMNDELWGQRTLRFFDPDGHLIEIGESLPVFVKRICDDEASLESAARRLFMEPEMVRGILGI